MVHEYLFNLDNKNGYIDILTTGTLYNQTVREPYIDAIVQLTDPLGDWFTPGLRAEVWQDVNGNIHSLRVEGGIFIPGGKIVCIRKAIALPRFAPTAPRQRGIDYGSDMDTHGR